jgi:hypothetical protein
VLRLARMPRGVLVALDPELEMEIRADLEERDESLDAEYTQ